MMLKLGTISQELAGILKTIYPYAVHFGSVDRSDAPYFYVEMQPRAKTWDRIISDRRIDIDIQLVLAEDETGGIDRMQLYNAADAIDAKLRPYIHLDDRFITVQGTETTIVDDVLHCIFTLSFADQFTDEEIGNLATEIMETLELDMKVKGD